MALTMDTDMVTFQGRTDVGHIPYQPLWLLIVRCVQFLLALIILALSAWAGGGFGFLYAGFGVGIFAFVWTLIFLLYIEITIFFVPAGYNKHIHVILESLGVVFWLSAFASLASVATAVSAFYSITCEGSVCSRSLEVVRSYPYVNYSTSDYSSIIGATKAAAALGAFEWVLFIGSLIASGIYLHRHRLSTQNALPGMAPPAAQQEIKMQPMVNQYPVDQTQQYQQYPQQQPYQSQSMA